MSALLWFSLGHHVSAAQPTNPAATPFLRFRDFNLSYTGPDGDSTNLTEIRLGWFGPTNVDDPLTGDLWWAAHLAEQVVAKANLPLVSPITTDKSVTLAGVSWMFACAPSDAAIARVLVDDILATLKGNLSADRRHPPDYATVLTYDATRLLIDAIRRAGPNRVRLREALTGVAPWAGLAGSIRFDGTGQNVRTNICMGAIHEGAVVLLEPRRLVCQTAARPPGA